MSCVCRVMRSSERQTRFSPRRPRKSPSGAGSSGAEERVIVTSGVQGGI